jgi:hypothetical protein
VGGAAASGVASLLQLRQHMGHLVTNLQIYLQLDVIDTNFSRLQQAIAQAQVRDCSCASHPANLCYALPAAVLHEVLGIWLLDMCWCA